MSELYSKYRYSGDPGGRPTRAPMPRVICDSELPPVPPTSAWYWDWSWYYETPRPFVHGLQSASTPWSSGKGEEEQKEVKRHMEQWCRRWERCSWISTRRHEGMCLIYHNRIQWNKRANASAASQTSLSLARSLRMNLTARWRQTANALICCLLSGPHSKLHLLLISWVSSTSHLLCGTITDLDLAHLPHSVPQVRIFTISYLGSLPTHPARFSLIKPQSDISTPM